VVSPQTTQAAARVQPERLNQQAREAGGFVGDDAPAPVARFDAGEQLIHAGEQARVHADLRLVVREEAFAQLLEFRVFGQDAEPGADQSARAGRCMGAQLLQRQVGEAARRAQAVQRAR